MYQKAANQPCVPRERDRDIAAVQAVARPLSARVDEAVRHRLLFAWNDAQADYPRERCIQELFAEQAARTPDATALICGDEQLTYAELDRRSNRLAQQLRTLGVRPEVIVGLCLDRCLEMIVALLAILKAGGAYLPLDPTYPEERLAYMIRDSGAHLVLSGENERLALAGLPAELIVLDKASLADETSDAPASGAVAENLVYVMYTSGSTGTPKAAGIVHYNVTRLVRGANYVDIKPDDVFLQLAPLAFDAATFEIWGALLNGAKLVLYPDRLLDLGKLKRLIAETGVSILWLTAGLFHRIVDESPSLLAPVRQLLSGGDALSVPHVKRVLAELRCQLINGYGPTECTSLETACMQFIPGTQRTMYYDESKGMHYDPARVNRKEVNGVLRGFFGYDWREIQKDPNWEPDESQAVSVPCRAGQFIIFWSTLMHASLPHLGKSKEMRLGFAARYVPASVTVYAAMKETNIVKELGGSFSLDNFGSILVSGRDEFKHNRMRTHTTRGKPFINSNPR